MPDKQPDNIFDAARGCDAATVKSFLDKQPALASEKNEKGFTALHYAAFGSNSVRDEQKIMDTLKLLVEAGSPLEAEYTDGRTALYFLAEFCPFVAPVQYLIDAGANPNVSSQGNHVVVNAMSKSVKELLSNLTGVAIPPPPKPAEKMSTAAWKKAKKVLDEAFDELNKSGLIAIQDTGVTQSDAFSDCSQAYFDSDNKDSITGFCFYTRQDLNRAKRTSQLPLGIWGAPEGADADVIRVGKLVTEIFEKHQLETRWNGSAGTRPEVYLYDFN